MSNAIGETSKGAGDRPVKDLDKLILVYRDASGEEHHQPASDLMEAGTLVDPETDEDMDMIGWLETSDDAPKPAAQPPLAVVVRVEGGVAKEVCATVPGVDVLVVDCDTSGCDDQQLRDFPEIDELDKHGRVITSRGTFVADPQRLSAMWSPEYVAHAFDVVDQPRGATAFRDAHGGPIEGAGK